MGERGKPGGSPGTGEASLVPGDIGDSSGIGTTFRAGGSGRCVQAERVVIYDI